MGRRSRELVRALGPGEGNPTPVRSGEHVCRACKRFILPGQPQLFGVHRMCMTVDTSNKDAVVYRTPEGGMIRLGKPKPAAPRPAPTAAPVDRHGRYSRHTLRNGPGAAPAAPS